MNSRSFFYSRQTQILAAVLLLVAGGAWAASESPGGGSPEGVVTIATGPVLNVDGALAVSPDDFGEWASVTFGGGGDSFDPAGPLGALEAAFSDGFWIGIPSRSEHKILTENASHLGAADDGSLALAVTSPSVASDGSGDGVNDTLNSSFTVTGTASTTALSVDLTQVVGVVSADASAILCQEYVITNDDTASIDFNLVRVFDGDLLWVGDFSDDQVGTDFNTNGGDRYIFEQEPTSSFETSITVSGPDSDAYYGAKNTIVPNPGGPPPYNFGTAGDVFAAFGMPISWQNNIANLIPGNNVDGNSGSMPGDDASTGLSFQVSIAGGDTETVTVFHTFGQDFPGDPPEGCGTPPPPPPPEPPTIEIPTLGSAGLIALAVIIALAGGLFLRRRFAP